MRSPQTDPNRGRAGRRFPALEALEDRCCPSTISFSNHTLLITGDDTANAVTIQDAGTGKVTATVRDANGKTTTSSVTGVQTIQVNTNGGNDTVNYVLGAALTTSESLSLNLGKGDNRATLDFSKGVSAPALTVRVNGADLNGSTNLTATFGAIKNTALDFRTALATFNDQVFINLNGDLTGTARADFQVPMGPDFDGVSFNAKGTIAATASLEVDSTGGASTDTFHVNYQGQLLGKLTIHTQGGSKGSWIESDITLAAGSTGSLEALLTGGKDDDLLILQVTDNSHKMHSLVAQLDGGAGQNEAVVTSNVKVLHASLT